MELDEREMIEIARACLLISTAGLLLLVGFLVHEILGSPLSIRQNRRAESCKSIRLTRKMGSDYLFLALLLS
jgi:hypothetical protein